MKVCVITGTRADYGLLRWVMDGISKSSLLELQVVVTGMHLSPEFGLTYKSIEEDGFTIDDKIEMLVSSDTSIGISKSIGLGVIGFSDCLMRLKPNLVLILGDRFEALSAATAALISRIPIAHLHGGEKTEGAFDEAIRHSITKMSHLHFVAAEEYRQRVIQLGEDPSRVFLVGGMGLDNIKRIKLLARNELETSLDFKFKKRNLLVTFHPVTLEMESSRQQVSELISALDELEETGLIFTMPNADTDGRVIFDMINEYVANREGAKVFTSLGQQRYLSTLAQVDGVVGNSSSGIIEAPSLKVGTINIGDRQKGRLKAASVIDCLPDKESIKGAINILYSKKFKHVLEISVNPYGDGGASVKVVSILESLLNKISIIKTFYDIPLHGESSNHG